MIGLPALLLQSLRVATPLCLAGLGGLYSERAGKANIALEGMMLVGAFGCAFAAAISQSPVAGLIAGVVSGLLLAGLHALCVVGMGVHPLLSGVVMNLFAAGFTEFLFLATMDRMDVNGGVPDFIKLRWLLFLWPPMVLLSHVFFSKTPWGLRWRAVGEDEAVSRSFGLATRRYTVAGILLSGALCGLAGSYLALDAGQFVRGMSSGRGFLALAALIISNWRPLRLLAVCLAFASLEALRMHLDLSYLPTQLTQALPYILTLMALAGLAPRSRPPAGMK